MDSSKRVYSSFKKRINLKGTYKQVENSDDPLFPTSTTETREIWCLRTRAKIGEIQSGMATATDVVILFNSYDFDLEIRKGDTITIGSKIYPIKFSQPTEAIAGETILNKVFCEVR